MSGGHFNYEQYELQFIAEEIQQLINSNDDETPGEWGYPHRGKLYSEQTIERFRQTVLLLNLAQEFAQRVDWLVSGDDSEESFHRRLNEFLEEVEKERIREIA